MYAIYEKKGGGNLSLFEEEEELVDLNEAEEILRQLREAYHPQNTSELPLFGMAYAPERRPSAAGSTSSARQGDTSSYSCWTRRAM